MKQTQNKHIEMKRHVGMLAILLAPVAALILGAVVPEVSAQPECFFNIELNATDRDVGVRGFFDYDPWKELEIENPRGRTIVEVEAEKSMKRQGFAEWFYESGEPPLDEVSFKKFFRRFPEGDYEFEAEPIKGGEVECVAEFTHVIPCGPVPTADVDKDAGIVTISWHDVEYVVDTEATDDTGGTEIVCTTPDPEDPLVIESYEIILEGEDTEFNFIVSADTTQLILPLAILEKNIEYKYEVLAIEESGNQSITEAFFMTP
ncbi:MAG: hypothetical protein PVG74_16700 [Desulfobacterales bacterium]|jgi:hypothetical protein